MIKIWLLIMLISQSSGSFGGGELIKIETYHETKEQCEIIKEELINKFDKPKIYPYGKCIMVLK